MVPIDRIEVLNSRERNEKVFGEIVENIRDIVSTSSTSISFSLVEALWCWWAKKWVNPE